MPYSRANGVDIWYELKGDGPAMVFVHANPFDHDLWLYQTAHFSTWFKTIAIDIRGYGRSSKVTTPYALKDMCDDVIGVMNDLGVARAICCGCSVGSGHHAPARARSSRQVRRGDPGRRQQRRQRALPEPHRRLPQGPRALPPLSPARPGAAGVRRQPARRASPQHVGRARAAPVRAKRSRRCSWPATTPT